MRTSCLILYTAILMTLLNGCRHNSSPRSCLEAHIDSLLEARYPNPNEPGGAVLVAKGDSIIYERYFGVADMKTGQRINDSTLFNIASVSKQFTAAALLQQDVDMNELAIDYFDFPQDFWKDITLGHLASHSSGLPDSRDRSNKEMCIYADDAASASYFPTITNIKFQPGTAYDYLNPSFILLAQVVEQKTDREFTEYMQDSIFDVAGMTHTMYFSPNSMPANTAHGYKKDEKGWQEFDYGEETFFATLPDGGIYTTPRDLLKWELALADGKILSPSRLEEAYEPRVNVSDSQWCSYERRPYTWYGYGWFITKRPNEPTKIYHPGENGGFRAYLGKYPERDLYLIVLENRPDKDRWNLVRAIDNIMLTQIKD